MTKNAFSIYILSFVFFSCSSEKSFNFEIENRTEFKIDVLEFSCGFEKKTIKIEPNSTTSTELVYWHSASKYLISKAFKEPELCITVVEFSDSKHRYLNSIGNAIRVSNFDVDKLNRMEIRYRNDRRNRFEINVLGD